MNTDTFQLVCSLITAIAGVIPTIVSVVLLVRNIIKNKDWQQVCEIAKAAMTAAEKRIFFIVMYILLIYSSSRSLYLFLWTFFSLGTSGSPPSSMTISPFGSLAVK